MMEIVINVLEFFLDHFSNDDLSYYEYLTAPGINNEIYYLNENLGVDLTISEVIAQIHYDFFEEFSYFDHQEILRYQELRNDLINTNVLMEMTGGNHEWLYYSSIYHIYFFYLFFETDFFSLMPDSTLWHKTTINLQITLDKIKYNPVHPFFTFFNHDYWDYHTHLRFGTFRIIEQNGSVFRPNNAALELLKSQYYIQTSPYMSYLSSGILDFKPTFHFLNAYNNYINDTTIKFNITYLYNEIR